MKYILILVLFIGVRIHSQIIDTIIYIDSTPLKEKLKDKNLEFIEKIDTVYIYFDYGKGQKKSFANDVEKIPEFYRNSLSYSFTKDSLNYFTLVYQEYKDFDDFALKKKADIKKVKEKFLKTHKNSILNPEFIFNQDFETLFFMLDSKKVYIIDKKEIKCGKINLREISMMISPYEYIE